MKLNIKKCKVLALRIVSDSSKLEAFNPELKINNADIDFITIDEPITVLGVIFTANLELRFAHYSALEKYLFELKRINESTLYIPNKLHILRSVAVPVMENAFFHTDFPIATLKKLDVINRKCIKKWFDSLQITDILIESPYKPYGGLGIPSMLRKSSLYRVIMFIRLIYSNDELIRDAIHARIRLEKVIRLKSKRVTHGVMNECAFFDWTFDKKSNSKSDGMLLVAFSLIEYHVSIYIDNNKLIMKHNGMSIDTPNKMILLLKNDSIKQILEEQRKIKNSEYKCFSEIEMIQTTWRITNIGMKTIPSCSCKYTRSYLCQGSKFSDREIQIILRTQLLKWYTNVIRFSVYNKLQSTILNENIRTADNINTTNNINIDNIAVSTADNCSERDERIKCAYCKYPESVDHLLTIPPEHESDKHHPKGFGECTRDRHDKCVERIKSVILETSLYDIIGGDKIKYEDQHSFVQHTICSLNIIESATGHVHKKPDIIILNKEKSKVYIIDITYTADHKAYVDSHFYTDIEKNPFVYDEKGFLVANNKLPIIQTRKLFKNDFSSVETCLNYSPSARYLVKYSPFRDFLYGAIKNNIDIEHNITQGNILIIPLVFGVKGFIPSATIHKLSIMGINKKLIDKTCYSAAE
jgi:hypothetical protein